MWPYLTSDSLTKVETMSLKHCTRVSLILLLTAATTACTQSAEKVPNTPPGAAYFVSQSIDDAEEGANGKVDLANDDLDLGQASGFESAVAVGIRFDGIRIPKGSKIKSAFLQFTKDEPGTKDDPTNLTIRAELIGDAESFRNEPRNISTRSLTKKAVNWLPQPWHQGDGRSERQQTPNLSAVIQEVIERDDWKEGNALAIVFSGNGERDAMSFDGGGKQNGPTLYLETH
jgi:hypothetical protein